MRHLSSIYELCLYEICMCLIRFFFLGNTITRDCLQVCYEVLVAENQEVDFGEDHTEQDPHVIRVGWSQDATSFQLGIHVQWDVTSFWVGGCHKKMYSLFGKSHN